MNVFNTLGRLYENQQMTALIDPGRLRGNHQMISNEWSPTSFVKTDKRASHKRENPADCGKLFQSECLAHEENTK